MRYLIRARLKPGKERALKQALEDGVIGQGSVAEGEYERALSKARILDDGQIKWVEICYCSEPLEEELPYWEEFFEIESIKDAHNRLNCKDANGSEPWSCGVCDCTEKLEQSLEKQGTRFIDFIISR
ncbi:MAG: hypothetical protein H6751_17730 [Candidatus Omnitrophica bacterium]|nr:hypothetical protein [Candidatus Omnitrophota bacterium]MCB9769639.1 hypothetical protein [Candidatus Omnitrophota bacterium]MCB9784813.1 hypothetical protein [Candidatus Omnitrophota bacterium]